MYLAKYGFAVVNANYRLVPQIGFQGQLHDALDAIIWTNEHAHDYGMDTNALFLIEIPRPPCLSCTSPPYSIHRSSRHSLA